MGGTDAQLLLVSRNGALYKNRYNEIVYNIEGANQLIGTLISIRVPYPVPQVNIYDYIDGWYIYILLKPLKDLLSSIEYVSISIDMLKYTGFVTLS